MSFTSPRRRHVLLCLALLAAYAVLVTALACRHVLWRDEAEAWLVARSSTGLVSLLHNDRYEGHPPLWHFILFLITRVTWNPEWMKVPNVLFSIATAALLLFRTRLSLLERAGFTFSYFLAFEYAVISRNYMIGIFLLLAAVLCILRRSDRDMVPVTLLLMLAAITSIPATIVACVLFCLWMLLRLSGDAAFQHPLPRRLPDLPSLLAAAAFFSVVLFAVWIVLPPPNSDSQAGFESSFNAFHYMLVRLPGFITAALLPLPRLHPLQWNQTLVQMPFSHLRLLLSFVFVLAVVWLLRSPLARIFFVSAAFLVGVEISFSQRAYMRHIGWYFVIFLLALLIDRAASDAAQRNATWRSALLGVILATQVAALAIFTAASLRTPFSPSLALTQYLERPSLRGVPIVFEPFFIAAPYISYSRSAAAFDFDLQRNASFEPWQTPPTAPLPFTRASLQARFGYDVRPIVITRDPLTADAQQQLGLRPLLTFPPGLNGDERYFLYR